MQAQPKLPAPAFPDIAPGAPLSRRVVVLAVDAVSEEPDIAPGAPLSRRAHKTTPYQPPAEVMADAAREGMRRIGFTSDPRDAN